MKRLLLAILAAVVATLALVVVLNQIDEPLKPEVQHILDKKPNPTEVQLQAYKFLQEHYSEFKDVKALDCGSNGCGSKRLKERPELKAELEKYKTPVQNYVKLMEFGDIGTNFSPTPEQPLQGVMLTSAGIHEYFVLQLAVWREKGGGLRALDLLESSNKYLRRVMDNGTLLERMMAAVLMQRNADFLVQELEAQPAFRKLFTQDLLSSFSTPDAHDILSGALENELQVLSAFVRTTARDRLNFDLLFFDWLLIRPNETLNEYYVLASESLATDCQMVEENAEDKCLPSWRKLNAKWPWEKVINPTGRYLVKLIGAGYVNRKQKLDKIIKHIYEVRKALAL